MFFVINRLLQAGLIMVIVAMLAFIMFQFVGDPVNSMVGIETTPEDREKLRIALGLDKSIWEQFLVFFGNVLQGNFGNSYEYRMPVSDLIQERLPATLELAITSTIVSILMGIPMGIYSAIKQKGVGVVLINIFALFGVAIPTFVMGLVFIMFFSVTLGWLPSFGRGETIMLGWWSTGFFSLEGLQSLILPSLTLALYQTTLIMRLVRSEMLEVLQQDYIKFARARGIDPKKINRRYALKNTMMPVVTIIGLQLGGVIAFSIVTETVFQWPGMGLLFIQAVQAADIPVMSSYLIMIALFFVIINLIVDFVYALIDPRLRRS